MKARLYRGMIVVALVTLTGLLTLQIYWFVKAYNLQEKQFDQSVSLALRSVADKLLKMDGDVSSRIPPVTQPSSNSFRVELKSGISYASLDSVINQEFSRFEIFQPFELSVYDHKEKAIVFGNFYGDGARKNHEQSKDIDVTCLKRDHTASPVNFSVSFPDKKSEVLGSMNLWIFTSITILLILFVFGIMLIDLSKQKKLAEIKADFLNNMTHELQTPIANIAMASEVLRSSTKIDENKTKRYLDIIHDENMRLKFHMEHVLQIAKLERGEMEMNRKEIDINQLVSQVTSIMEERVIQRNGQIVKTLNASQPRFIGDPFHLTNLLYNLIDNADKYSSQNPQITITTENKEKGILISVADKGIGISREVQKFIFDKFYRATTGNIHDVKGFGLGLTYVQQVAHAHQGSVTVFSEENKGSRFDVYLEWNG